MDCEVGTRKILSQERQLLLNSSDYGVPQSRPRAWMIYFRGHGSGIGTALQSILKLKHEPWPLERLLTEWTDVENEQAVHRQGAGVISLQDAVRLTAEDKPSSWKAKLQEILAAHGLLESRMLETAQALQTVQAFACLPDPRHNE